MTPPPSKKIEKFSFVSLDLVVLLVLLVPSLLLAGIENNTQTTKRWAEFQSTASLEPISGFEPETPSLRVKCSTAELNRIIDYISKGYMFTFLPILFVVTQMVTHNRVSFG